MNWGARMVADFFELDGWDTYFLGANTPTDSILRAVEERRADILVEVSLKQVDDHFCLAVRDQGPGIPPDEQGRLFQAFGRGRVKGTAGEKSTGLGLMIVKRIVTGHGGKIWLESEPGQGMTFFVSIPFQPPEESV
jgi:signal transduction histidine kinase